MQSNVKPHTHHSHQFLPLLFSHPNLPLLAVEGRTPTLVLTLTVGTGNQLQKPTKDYNPFILTMVTYV